MATTPPSNTALGSPLDGPGGYIYNVSTTMTVPSPFDSLCYDELGGVAGPEGVAICMGNGTLTTPFNSSFNGESNRSSLRRPEA